MKAAVCEDSFADMEFLKKSIKEACAQIPIHMEINYFYSGEDLLEAVRSGQSYSLLLCDIYLQQLDGVAVSRQVRELLPNVQIAFLTISQEFMLDAFDLNALHYLIKPVSVEKLKECLERFCERIRIPPQMLEIKSDFKTYTYPLSHVQKIISYKKGVDIYLHGLKSPQHAPISFTKVEQQLDPDLFLRISRGFIVQMSYIQEIDGETCRLKDGTEVLISRRGKTAVRKKYNDYLFQK